MKPFQATAMRILAIFLFIFSCAAWGGEWATTVNGCKVWNPSPVANETVTWSGVCTNGYIEGRGELKWIVNGKATSGHVGDFKNGMTHGQATTTFTNGDKYVGEYKDGIQNGHGAYTWANGRKYVGEFKDNKMNGRGYILYPPEKHPNYPKLLSDGSQWIGEFKNNQLHGLGVYTDGWTKKRYEGIWENGEIVHHCQVTLIAENNEIPIQSNCRYEDVKEKKEKENVKNLNRKDLRRCSGDKQEWNDCWGKYDYENGTSIMGEFKNGTLNGEGKIEYGRNSKNKGEKFTGLFVGNIPDGYGIYTFENKSKYFGEVKYGLPNGDGVQISLGDKPQEGLWEKGVFKRSKKIELPKIMLNFPQDGDELNLLSAYLNNSISSNNEENIHNKKRPSAEELAQQQSKGESITTDVNKNTPRAEGRKKKIDLTVTNTQPAADGSFTITILTNIDTASLRINGNEEGGRQDGKYQIRLIARAGQKTDINIIATDIYGNTDTKTITVNREVTESKAIFAALNPAQLKRQAERDAIAIIIGISNYKTLPKAEFSNDDARVFYDYAIRALGIKPENIRLLVDSDAEEVEIIKAFKTWLPSRVKSTTDVYVYYSGHGLPTQDGLGLYLLPARADREFISRTSIQFQEISADLQAAKPKSVTIFMDSCYSGQTRSGETLIASARPLALKAQTNIFPVGFNVFSASQSDQISSSSPDLKHGIFSYYLMKGMEGDADTNKDGKITLGEMQGYLVENVGRQAGMMNRKQEPQLIGDPSRVLVGR